MTTRRQAFTVLGTIAAATLVAIAVFVWFFVIPSDADNAATACHDDIRPRMKNPAGVEFLETSTARVEDGFFVSGTGTGTNSFGATVSFEYFCTVDDDGTVTTDVIE